VWALHGFPGWKPAPHPQRTPEMSAAQSLLGALAVRNNGRIPKAAAVHSRLWPQAYAHRPAGQPYFYNRHIGLCGDWCLGRRVEDAWASGRALAARLILEHTK
jgi:renalase